MKGKIGTRESNNKKTINPTENSSVFNTCYLFRLLLPRFCCLKPGDFVFVWTTKKPKELGESAEREDRQNSGLWTNRQKEGRER